MTATTCTLCGFLIQALGASVDGECVHCRLLGDVEAADAPKETP